MKVLLNYTEKNAKSPRMLTKIFESKKAALAWVKRKAKKLYWHQIVAINPKSKHPKPVVLFELGDEYQRFTGVLSTYFETGMEALGLVFERDDVSGPPNPNFDPSQPENRNNFKNFKTLDGLIFLKHGQILQIGEDGEKIALIKDIDFAKSDGFRLTMYPRGFKKNELLDLFQPGTTKATLWVKKTQPA